MRRSLVLAGLLSVASLAHAAPFDPRTVGEEAKFVIFVDMEAGRKTALGEFLLAKLLDNPDYQDFEKILVSIAGFMPASDINDFTIWGDKLDENPKAALVIHAKFDAAALRGGLSLADDFHADTYADREVLNWNDRNKNKRMNACLFDGNTILMSEDAENLKKAIDVLADANKSLEGHDGFPRPDKKNWAFFGGAGLSAAPKFAENPILAQINNASIEIGEADGNTVATINATTAAADKGTQLFNFANGLKALGVLAGQPRRGQPDPDEKARLAAELASQTTFKQEGPNIIGTTAIKNERVVEVLDEVMERRAGTLPAR